MIYYIFSFFWSNTELFRSSRSIYLWRYLFLWNNKWKYLQSKRTQLRKHFLIFLSLNEKYKKRKKQLLVKLLFSLFLLLLLFSNLSLQADWNKTKPFFYESLFLLFKSIEILKKQKNKISIEKTHKNSFVHFLFFIWYNNKIWHKCNS